MLEIPGIEPEKVEIHGKDFLELVKKAQHFYESMMQQQEDRVQDPNHMNVIDISDDDEELGDYDLDDLDDNGSYKERSSYFPPREVEAFNAQSGCFQHKPLNLQLMMPSVTQLQPPLAEALFQSHDTAGHNGASHKRGSRGGSHGRGRFKKPARKSSNGSSKAQSSTRGSKKPSYISKPTKAYAQSGPGGGGGIGMMPI